MDRAFAVMTKADASKGDVEAYFGSLAADTDLGASMRRNASELVRRTMIWFGDYRRAIAAYRALADASEEAEHVRAAWLEVAYLASNLSDEALLDTAIGHVMADGTDTEQARMAARDWPDMVTASR